MGKQNQLLLQPTEVQLGLQVLPLLEARCGLFFFLPSSSSMGKQSQLPLKPTEVEFGLQVGVEFDNIRYFLLEIGKVDWKGN